MMDDVIENELEERVQKKKGKKMYQNSVHNFSLISFFLLHHLSYLSFVFLVFLSLFKYGRTWGVN